METLPDRFNQGVKSLSPRNINPLTDYFPKFCWDTWRPSMRSKKPPIEEFPVAARNEQPLPPRGLLQHTHKPLPDSGKHVEQGVLFAPCVYPNSPIPG